MRTLQSFHFWILDFSNLKSFWVLGEPNITVSDGTSTEYSSSKSTFTICWLLWKCWKLYELRKIKLRMLNFQVHLLSIERLWKNFRHKYERKFRWIITALRFSSSNISSGFCSLKLSEVSLNCICLKREKIFFIIFDFKSRFRL